MKSRIESSKRYLFAGLFTNLLGYLFFCLIQFYLRPNSPVVSFLISAIILLPISFLINRNWVFQSSEFVGPQVVKFSGTYFGAIASGVFILTLLQSSVPNPYLAQLTSAVLVGVSTFLIHSFWTFDS
jgi:putative flippase GtrA